VLRPDFSENGKDAKVGSLCNPKKGSRCCWEPFV